MALQVKAREHQRGDEVWWTVNCPLCQTTFKLDECPAPGGIGYNVEFCPECGTELLITN